MNPRQDCRVVVVTIVHGRHGHLDRQHRSLVDARARPDLWIVVAMGDERIHTWAPQGVETKVVPVDLEPDGLPLAKARNAGANAALHAGADALIFLDVDCLPGPELVHAYAEAARSSRDVVWSGPVTYLPPAPVGGYDLTRLIDLDAPHPGRPAPSPGEWTLDADPDLFWSLSFALHKSAWGTVGGFCEDYVGYGAEDTDFARLADRAGLRFGWLGSARAYHQHHPTQSPPRQHVDAILRNGRLFHKRWGRWPMLGWLEAFEREGVVVKDGDHWSRASAPRPA